MDVMDSDVSGSRSAESDDSEKVVQDRASRGDEASSTEEEVSLPTL